MREEHFGLRSDVGLGEVSCSIEGRVISVHVKGDWDISFVELSADQARDLADALHWMAAAADRWAWAEREVDAVLA